MLFTAVVPALLTVALALNLSNLWVALATMLVVGVGGAIYFGLRAAILPEVLPQEDMYIAGRALLRVSSQATQVIGSISGGAFVLTLGASGALWFNAASFLLLAALVFIGIPRALSFSEHDEPEAAKPGMRAVAATVLRTPGLVGVLLIGWLAPCFAISVETLAAPYVSSIGRDPALLSLILAASGAGMVVGDVIASRMLSASARTRLILPAAVLFVGSSVVFLAEPNLEITLGIVFIAGLGIMCLPGLDSATIRLTPKSVRGTVLSVQFLIFLGIQGVAALLWGVLGSTMAPNMALALIGALGIVTIVVLYLATHRAVESVKANQEEAVES
ncbi:MFS transporter [Tomitella fengzijianii]|uniref:MFS transporter n=1 Tax=Tomitella fengzijianii TaxID=2597660 RepID=A0A516X2F2_9ACTN|nr:MFS transporter [Tomitella fengzijianii]QDQ97210.1 MFS transporter [Tomitella fengzijianii]